MFNIFMETINMSPINIMALSLILYLIGSVPFAIITSKLFNLPDPRSFGSMNPGATNVMRSGNKLAAAITLLGDLLKGFIPVFFIINDNIDIALAYLISLFIVIGHIYPIFVKFRGGKGVATSIGIIIAINLYVGLLFIFTWIAAYILSRVSGLSALIAFTILPIYFYALTDYQNITYIAVINSIIIFLTHTSNIKSLNSK